MGIFLKVCTFVTSKMRDRNPEVAVLMKYKPVAGAVVALPEAEHSLVLTLVETIGKREGLQQKG